MMNTGFAMEAFETQESDFSALNLEGIEDFLAYMDSPRSIGLDGMKSELRHMILLMMELQGYDTGYRSQQMLGFGHTSLILNGVLASDAKKMREEMEYWESLYKLLDELERTFSVTLNLVQKRIDTIQEHLVEEVKAIDQEIQAEATSDAHVVALKAGHERRNVLKWLLHRLDRHEADLQEANSTAEVVQLHQKVEQDVEDVKQGNVSANRSANRPSPFTQISEFVKVRRKEPPKHEHEHDREYGHDRHSDSEDSKDTSGKGGKSGKGGSSGGSSGESSSGDKDDLPPPPVTPQGF